MASAKSNRLASRISRVRDLPVLIGRTRRLIWFGCTRSAIVAGPWLNLKQTWDRRSAYFVQLQGIFYMVELLI
jgi:hypothetical protein